MSRGWESKSVEGQQSEAAGPASVPNPSFRRNMAEDADRIRTRQALELQRERILSERTSSAHRRNALENALADIEEKLGELGWTVHL